MVMFLDVFDGMGVGGGEPPVLRFGLVDGVVDSTAEAADGVMVVGGVADKIVPVD